MEDSVRGVFVDANEALAVIFERLAEPGDPAVRIHRDPDVAPEQLPGVLGGAAIAIVDHTRLPTDIARKCAGLKHVVFLGTGARSYMNPEELGELGIAVQFPKNWQVHNLPTALLAVSPQGEVQLQMKLDESPDGTPGDYARNLAGYGAQITTLSANGLPAALFNLPDMAGGVIFYNQQAFILQAKGKSHENLASHRDEIAGTVRSFHAITNRERLLVKPLTLHVITARAGDTFADLSQGSPLGESAESYLRLINASYPSGEPQAGQLIKLVR